MCERESFFVCFLHVVAHRACCTWSEPLTTEGASSCRCAGLWSSPRLLSCMERPCFSQDTPEHGTFWSLFFLSIGSVGGVFHQLMVSFPPFSHLPPFLTQTSEHIHTSSEHGVWGIVQMEPGLLWELNPGPLAPKARSIQLDQAAS